MDAEEKTSRIAQSGQFLAKFNFMGEPFSWLKILNPNSVIFVLQPVSSPRSSVSRACQTVLFFHDSEKHAGFHG